MEIEKLRKKKTMVVTLLQRVAALLLLASYASAALVSDWNDSNDVVLKIKHKLGSIKSDASSGKNAAAIEKIEAVEKMLVAWKEHLGKDPAEAAPADAAVADGDSDRVSSVEFNIKVNHTPKSCKRKTAKGDKLKVHYIAKLLPEKKMVDSSFHTGSMPFKFTLGSKDALVPGWNDGLTGMCKGERRDVTIPAALAYGMKGNAKKKVPANADLLFHMELVDFSKGHGGDL